MKPYVYLISGRRVVKDGPMFFFEWTVDGGHTPFGWHGTDKEWEARLILEKKEDEERGRPAREIKIFNKREIPREED